MIEIYKQEERLDAFLGNASWCKEKTFCGVMIFQHNL